jgi:hypothetical protein
VAGELAAEGRFLRAHGGLDERVPDAVAHGHAAGARDLLLHDPRGAQVVDDRRARVLLQDLARQERRHQVVPHRAAGLVDEAAAVGVAVEADAQLGLRRSHERAHRVEVLLLERVGLVVGERAVELGEDRLRADARARARGSAQRVAGHPVGAVDRDRDVALEPREPRDVVGVGREQVALLERAAPRGGRRLGPATMRSMSRMPFAAEIGVAPRPLELHAVVLARVVAGGDVQAAVAVGRADREVAHGRAGEPDVDHVRARAPHALDDRRGDRRRVRAHVAPDHEPLRTEELRESTSDPPRELGVQLGPGRCRGCRRP